MRHRKRLFRLMAWWNPKDRDTYAEVSPRFSGGDMSWLMDKVFTREVLKELDERGYDLSTMWFEIDRKPEAIEDHFRIAPNSEYREQYEREKARGRYK